MEVEMKHSNRKCFSWFLACFLLAFVLLPLVSYAETDVTEKIEIEESRLRYDRRAKTSSLNVAITNISADTMLSPVKVVITSISSPDVTIENAPGLTSDGKPYFEYDATAPGNTSDTQKWVFKNTLRKRFSYNLVIFDATPTTILVTGKAIAGLPVVGTINIKDSSDPANTTSSAINSDGSYSLTIDNDWAPPFMMWAEGWVNNQHLRLLSCFDLEEDETEININTTPATTSIVESAMGKDASEIDPATEDIPAPELVDAIREKVEDTLANLFAVVGIPPGFNLFETPIGEVGSPEDQLFDTIGVESDDQGNIVFTDLEGEEFIIDPDGPPGTVPQEIIDNVVQTGDSLDQISLILSDFFNLFGDSNNLPDLTKLEAELAPDLATGFLHRGEGISDWIDRLNLNASQVAPNEVYIGSAIFRPMTTQHYGNIPVEEMPDNHDSGLWVLVTTNTNGKVMSFLTSFVDIGNNTWKWYGNRQTIRRTDRGRPYGRQLSFPAGAVTYHSGLGFWHNDVGNLALDMGITNLAIFNSAFAPETIDGIATNCVRLERREGGLDTRFRLSNVPHYWTNDTIYELSKEPGDRRIDLDNLKSQETIEFIVIGLDDLDNPIKTWLYTIPEAPKPVSEIMANTDNYFALIERDTVSFQTFDSNNPDNPDAFPGNDGVFSWIFPNNPELFPSWTQLGWDDVNWNWNNLQIDNPAWYSIGDFHDFTSGIYQPGANANLPRTAELTVTMRDTNQMHYQANKRYDPWSEDVLSFENGSLVMDLAHSYKSENLTDRLATRFRIRDKEVTRLEARIKVEDGFFIDAEPDNSRDVEAHTDIKLVYQAEEKYIQGIGEGYFEIAVRIALRKDGTRHIQCWLETYDNDWNTIWSTHPGYIESGETESKFPGSFPLGSMAETSQNATYHTLAIELDKVNSKMVVEFDGQSSAIDLSEIPGFNADDFQSARIRTRVRNINEPGDEGSIKTLLDNVRVNGELYDDFDNGFGISKWYINSYE